jgi:hypothetical protein
LKGRGKTLRRILLDRSSSLTIDLLGDGKLDVLEHSPSYRDGMREAASVANPAEKALIYMEIIKEAHNISQGTLRKIKRELGI